MSPEKGPLQLWEAYQREKGNITGAEIARTLREQFGDIEPPLTPSETGVKLTPEPEILYTERREIIRRFVKEVITDKTYLIKPPVRRLSPDRFIRGRNILGAYLLSGATQEKIGVEYKLRQPPAETNRILNRAIRYLWLSASPVVKEHFILPKPVDRKIRLPRGPKKGISRPYKLSSKQPVLPPEGKPIHLKLKEALSGVNFTFIAPENREVLKQAFSEGVHRLIPPGMNQERWILYRNIFGTFILSHATLGQVGGIYRISRERVRQINEEVLGKLFPGIKPDLDKAIKYRPKEWLLVKDNCGSEIVEALEQGFSADQIISQYDKGSSRYRAVAVLKMLRDMGFEIKRIKNIGGEFLRIQKELQRKDISDDDIQKLFDQITIDGYKALLNSSVILPVGNLLKSTGFYYTLWRDSQLFYDALIDAGVPLGMAETIIQRGPQKGKRHYFFIAARHKQRAEEALKNNPALSSFLENPVKQVSGPETKIPNTTQIMKKDRVLSLASILTEFGIPVKSPGRKSSEIKSAVVADNILPVFVYSGMYYILEADLQKARSIIKAKLGSLNS